MWLLPGKLLSPDIPWLDPSFPLNFNLIVNFHEMPSSPTQSKAFVQALSVILPFNYLACIYHNLIVLFIHLLLFVQLYVLQPCFYKSTDSKRMETTSLLLSSVVYVVLEWCLTDSKHSTNMVNEGILREGAPCSLYSDQDLLSVSSFLNSCPRWFHARAQKSTMMVSSSVIDYLSQDSFT